MQRFSIYLSLFTISIYILLAALAMFTNVLDLYILGNMKYALGGVLLLYAVMRIFRARRMWLKMKNDEKNEAL